MINRIYFYVNLTKTLYLELREFYIENNKVICFKYGLFVHITNIKNIYFFIDFFEIKIKNLLYLCKIFIVMISL